MYILISFKFNYSKSICNTFSLISAGGKKPGTPISDMVSDTFTRVKWPANSDPVDEYEVTLTDSSGKTTTKRVPGDVTTASFMGLEPDSPYSVTVTAIKGGAAGQPSDKADFNTLPKGSVTFFL